MSKRDQSRWSPLRREGLFVAFVAAIAVARFVVLDGDSAIATWSVLGGGCVAGAASAGWRAGRRRWPSGELAAAVGIQNIVLQAFIAVPSILARIVVDLSGASEAVPLSYYSNAAATLFVLPMATLLVLTPAALALAVGVSAIVGRVTRSRATISS